MKGGGLNRLPNGSSAIYLLDMGTDNRALVARVSLGIGIFILVARFF